MSAISLQFQFIKSANASNYRMRGLNDNGKDHTVDEHWISLHASAVEALEALKALKKSSNDVEDRKLIAFFIRTLPKLHS